MNIPASSDFITFSTMNLPSSVPAGEVNEMIPTKSRVETSTDRIDIADILDLSSEALERANQNDLAVSLAKKNAFSQVTSVADPEQTETTNPVSLWKNQDAVANYLQLAYSPISDDQMAYFKMFDRAIESGDTQLELKIATLLEEAGIELGEDERFDIHIDEKGVISVTLPEGDDGEDNKARAERIAAVLNADETLAQDMLRVKALRNSRDSLLGLKVNEEEKSDSHLLGSKSLGKSSLPDMQTRKFLAEDYLQREFGLSLNDLKEDANIDSTKAESLAQLNTRFYNDTVLKEEIETVLAEDKEDESALVLTADYSFGGGVLLDLEETSDTNLEENLKNLFHAEGITDHPNNPIGNLAGAMREYNATALDEHKIGSFSIIMDDKGKMKIEGTFASGENLGSAKAMLESWLSPTFKALAEVTSDAMLQKHDAEHGDVDEYEHEVELKVDLVFGITAEIHSEEADRAALEDVGKATVEVAESLGDFVQETFYKENNSRTAEELNTLFSDPVDIYIDENGTLSVDETTCENQQYLAVVKETLSMLNDLLTDEKVPSGETSGEESLPEELKPVFQLLLQIQQDMSRLHDDSLSFVRFIL